jgi:hypothetical protein
MAKKGSTAKVGATTAEQGQQDFQGSGVEGAKAASQPADEKKKAEIATASGIVTGEHVLAMQRAKGKAA